MVGERAERSQRQSNKALPHAWTKRMTQVWGRADPKTRGEALVAAQLAQMDSNALTLAFNINFLPGVRDIDSLLIHQDLGAYFIEIKSYRINDVLEIGYNHFLTKAYPGTEPPWLQAYAQYEGFRDYSGARIDKRDLPNFAATALFHNISRYEWESRFATSDVAAHLSQKLMFREDLVDFNALESRLREVMLNPPSRSGRQARRVSTAFLWLVESLFAATPSSKPTVNERMKLKALEQGVNKKTMGDFPAGGETYAVFNGLPGTGKTFRLLSIGLHHAYSGCTVLFVCFNKTLAADTRRLLGFEDKLKLAKGRLEVLDVNQLALRCFEQNSMPFLSSSNADEWGEAVIEELKVDKDAVLSHYDTILVDESQDMQDWQLSLIRLHAKPNPTICLAVGEGQELYSDRNLAEHWLAEFAKEGTVAQVNLRRNFRNTDSQFFAALSFYLAWPDSLMKVIEAHQRVFSRKAKQETFDFDRTGEPLVYIPVPALPREFSSLPESQEEEVGKFYSEIILDELEKILDDGNFSPNGLLVLVPDKSSSVHTWVLRALQAVIKVHPEISYIDYTDEAARRSSAQNNEIRLCTFHSARGLEGEKVIIFGLETIAGFANKTNTRPENLGFIALSRGIFKTIAVVRTLAENHVHAILKETLKVGLKATQHV
jgi:hypothetical protein